ncbi:hypothetical protein P280DRAFT_33455 [Massarina eburnea CBS 473.64]|uniref:Uncharacterized protein n=1 Tax=Massarina eburnea CBS 473.64 TaxID=1395130 RepID=A0A6A6RYN3_9PLEO|nr:hypothetical protein P280DRAFT_33455 [Massarina eburnea CBS 473.64]
MRRRNLGGSPSRYRPHTRFFVQHRSLQDNSYNRYANEGRAPLPADVSHGPKVQNPSIPPANGACYLLSIPSELFDIIVAFALSRENGLYCRYEADRSPQDQEFKMYDSLEESLDDNANESNQIKSVCRQLFKETSTNSWKKFQKN